MKITLAPSDFDGVFCTTGDGCRAREHLVHDRPPNDELYYYIQSVPGQRRGTVAKDNPLARAFQEACDEWTKYTGMHFIRVKSKNAEYDFVIRVADRTEEEECTSRTVEVFTWSSSSAKVIKLWKSVLEWDAYGVFLHTVGHILGYRHEHAYRHGDVFMGNLRVDESSIMSYTYLKQFRSGCDRRPQLSLLDQSWAIDAFHSK